jgi:uncharacterized protein YdcH (DUF465 family)
MNRPWCLNATLRAVATVATTLLIVTSQPLKAASDAEVILLQELKKRDAVIAELLERVEKLEGRIKDTVVWVGPDQPAEPVLWDEVDELQSQLETLGEEPTAEETATERRRPRGPGAVEVDELAAERALERTLTTQGALLLPKGAREITPFFSYARREAETPLLLAPVLNFDGVNAAALSKVRTKRDETSFGVRTLFGLPYESQLEVELPFRVVRQQIVDSDAIFGQNASTDTGSSLGDIKLGLAKTLVREQGWRPDLIGRVTWDTDTGDRVDDDVVLGIGFHEFRGSLTALKRQDPLAFTGTISYTTALEKDDIKPGDSLGLTLGASLAASPSTSLSLALSQVFQDEIEVDGRKIDGSDENSSLLLFGASTVVGPRTLLSLSAGVGLTDAAPDYTVNLSLPMRF